MTRAFRLLVFVALLPTGCSGLGGAQDLVGMLREDMARCRQEHGYRPGAVRQGLAPGELEFRDCVYRSATALIVPAARYPDTYRLLLTEDRTMTDDIASGQASRQERAARLYELAQRIALLEKAGERRHGSFFPPKDAPADAGTMELARRLLVDALAR